MIIQPLIGVMHLVDTLDPGGKEKLAVNFVNHLPRSRYKLHLCTTRAGGVLEESVMDDVQRLCLQRKKSFDIRAIFQLVEYIRTQRIHILHAHASAFYIALFAAAFCPASVVWHQHSGLYSQRARPLWLFRIAARRMSGIISVNEELAEWSRSVLHVPASHVWYVPNYVSLPPDDGKETNFPGEAGLRIVCVANIRPEKGLVELIQAMKIVAERFPQVRLLLAGMVVDADYHQKMLTEIALLGLADQITWLGQRQDISSLLGACDIGVLSSRSEGLPLALLEYGMAGLPVVCTQVGECSAVLEHGLAGRLVPPGDPLALAQALVELLSSAKLRQDLGGKFHARVQASFRKEVVLERITQIYELVVMKSSHLHT